MDYEPSLDSSEESDSNNAVNISVQEVEQHAIEGFMRETCKCHYGLNGRACSCQFSCELIANTRMNCLEMMKKEVILFHLEANRHCFDGKEGSRFSINYWFRGYKVCKVCKSTYLFLHCVGPKQYKNLITHYC